MVRYWSGTAGTRPCVSNRGDVTACACAEMAGLPLAPHSNEAHNLALIFSQFASVCPVVEYLPNVEPDTGNEPFWKLFEGNPMAEEGNIQPSAGPGLGVSLRNDVLTAPSRRRRGLAEAVNSKRKADT